MYLARILKRKLIYTLTLVLGILLLINTYDQFFSSHLENQLLFYILVCIVALGSLVFFKMFRLYKRLKQENHQVLAKLGSKLDDVEKKLQTEYSQTFQKLNYIEGDFEKLSIDCRRIFNQADDLLSLPNKIEQIEAFVKSTIKEFSATQHLNNMSFFQPFNRLISYDIISKITDKWSHKLELKVSSKSIAYMAHRICVIESLSRGRLATSIEDIILRILVATSVKNNSLSVIEIGSLFGICLASIYDHTKSRFGSVHVTTIDPLDGYYGQNARDIITDECIDERIFNENISLFVPDKDYTLLKYLSTDHEAIDHVAKIKCDVLIIDGDHSYQGAKNDFDLYLPFVDKGGYIIFDDYNVDSWPDVKNFVDKEVMSNSAVEFVGAEWRTAVFRVKGICDVNPSS